MPQSRPPGGCDRDARATKVAISTADQDAKGESAGRERPLRGFQTDKRVPSLPSILNSAASPMSMGRWHAELPFGGIHGAGHEGQSRGVIGHMVESQQKGAEGGCETDARGGATVRATVLNAATLKPVPGAQVILDCGHAVTADESGVAVLTAVPMAERTLKAMLPPFGYAHVAFNPTGHLSPRWRSSRPRASRCAAG